MFYAIYSQKMQRIAAEGEGMVVCFDYRQNRKTLLPEEIKRKISELESSAGGDMHAELA